jgi:hypothetical protein
MTKYYFDEQRKNRFLPKGIYLWEMKSPYHYEKYRACLKVEGKTITIGYYDCLFKACVAFIFAHEEWYGTKPYWYKDFVKFYKKQKNLDF